MTIIDATYPSSQARAGGMMHSILAAAVEAANLGGPKSPTVSSGQAASSPPSLASPDRILNMAPVLEAPRAVVKPSLDAHPKPIAEHSPVTTLPLPRTKVATMPAAQRAPLLYLKDHLSLSRPQFPHHPSAAMVPSSFKPSLRLPRGFDLQRHRLALAGAAPIADASAAMDRFVAAERAAALKRAAVLSAAAPGAAPAGFPSAFATSLEHQAAAAKNGTPAATPRSKNFPEMLFDVISAEEEHGRIVSWLPHGKGFIIHDKDLFASLILPRYFDGAMFKSFTRRLKRWNFTCVSRGPELGAYYNDKFTRDHPELVQKMKYTG